tara:strand:- start:653 stop:1024 length:372 start_codon:yes stop_codon:yes gene_type:complete
MNNTKDRVLNVGSRTIDLKFIEPSFLDDNLTDCYGQFVERKNLIEIQKVLPTPELQKTILHELLHSFVSESKLSQNILSDDKDEELLVSHMETQIYQFFKNNPEMVIVIFGHLIERWLNLKKV